MELKEYIKIFKKNYKIFFITLGLILIAGSVVNSVLKTSYKVEVDLNITRTGYQKETTDYRYDEFYRLQADERFADTVVRWLGSAVVINDILKDSNSNFEKIKAQRLSSQMIKVSFLVANKNQAEKVTKAVDNVLNKKTAELNGEQNNPNWFKILTSYPIVKEYKITWLKLEVMLLLGGIFLGIWAVFIKHYLE